MRAPRLTVSLTLALVLAAALPCAARAATLPGWPTGAVVKSVRFAGAFDLRGVELARVFGVPTGRAPDSLAVAAGVERLVTALQGGGWLAARVDSVGAGARDRDRADLIVWLTPGPRQVIGRVTWEGLERFSPEQAAEIAGLVPGDAFRADRVGAGLTRLVHAYEERAFPAARASVLDLARRGDAVDVMVSVFEGDSVVVESATFEGARITRHSVLEKSMGNVVGLPYNRARLAQARQRLADLGVFTRVGEPQVESTGPGRARVVVPVVEARANTFDGAIGYQGESKTLTGLVDMRLENLGGRARQAGLYWEGRGPGRSEFRVRYAEPLLFGLNLKGEALLSQFIEDTLYTRTRIAGRFTFGVWGGGRAWLGAARERTVLEDGPVERATTTTTEAGFETDRRDDAYVPRRGYAARVSSGTVFKQETLRPSGTSHATQLIARGLVQDNRPVGRAAGARIELEGALRLSNEPVVPAYDLDLVGGAASLRGYREGEFQASRWAVLRLEYGVVTPESARAFAFLDQGTLYRPFLDAAGAPQSETLYRPGYGIGFEAPVSLGRFAVTLGYGKGDGPLDGKIHVRLTSRF
jgi:outer membrane protein assembly factor BamA